MSISPNTSPIEIFRPGTHTDMRGASLSFSENDLAAMADAYDPGVHEAPIVIGHPETTAPAWGWVKGLSAHDGRLLAEPDQLDPAFAELVKAGRYKKVSASFYRPDSAANPKPGVYYLRHVGFLGAQPPALKGLAPVSFAGADNDSVTFDCADPEAVGLVSRITGLLRGLRDYIIERDGADRAEAVLPSYALDGLQEQTAVALATSEPQPSYSEKEAPVSTVDPEKKEKPASLAETELLRRVNDLESREAAFAERQRRAEAESLVAAAVTAGRLTPAQAEGLASFAASLPEGETVSFAEDGQEKTVSPAAYLKTFLARLPRQVDFSEQSTPDDSVDGLTPSEAAARAVSYRERMARDGIVITTTDALAAVKAGKDK